MLDEKYDLPVPSHPGDTNIYTLGRIGGHQVVITSLPAGKTGVTAAAVVATRMLADFPDIRFGLMVGIGGAIPSDEHDIRLGDVVIYSGVVQFDLGKTTDTGFVQTGSLNQPPAILLAALSNIQAEYMLEPEKFPQYIQDAAAKFPKARKQFTYVGTEQDRLFEADYSHTGGSKTCADCDSSRVVTREARETTVPLVHYGTIASSNQVIKNAATRDRLGQEHGALCFEMEAAGLMNGFPCLVIRGICDYSDSHKNDQWQAYAAIAAAAYTKDLLSFISPAAVEVEEKAARLLGNIQQGVSKIHQIAKDIEEKIHDQSLDRKQERIVKWISNLDPSIAYTQAHKKRHPGTGRWFVDSDTFAEWKSQSSGFLWLHGIPGCGKTILVSTIIEALEQDKTSPRALLYFFFDFNMKFDLEKLIRSMINQLYRKWASIQHHVDRLWTCCEDGNRQPSLDLLKSTFSAMLRQTYNVSIVIDALDESEDRRELLDWIEASHAEAQFLITSRKETDIQIAITSFLQANKMVSLQKSDVDKDIAAYIRHVVTHDKDLVRRWRNRPKVQEDIEVTLTKKAGGMFRWAVLQIEKVKECIDQAALQETLRTLPEDLFKTYDRILEQIPKMHKEQACTMLMLMAWSERPLRQEELVDTIAIRLGEEPSFNKENRVPDITDLLRLCPGLMESRRKQESDNQVSKDELQESVIWAFTDELQEGFNQESIEELFMISPFLRYAAKYWTMFARFGEEADAALQKLVLEFMQPTSPPFMWCWSLPTTRKLLLMLKEEPMLPHPLMYASLHGLKGSVENLWEQAPPDAVDNMPTSAALHAASALDFEGVVRLLLSKGVDADIPVARHGTCLQAAAYYGHLRVVEALLRGGADVNKRGLLLDWDAIIVFDKGSYGSALQAAAFEGHREIVELLLRKEADVNLQIVADGENDSRTKIPTFALSMEEWTWLPEPAYGGNALYAAISGNHINMANYLLEVGADVNAKGGIWGNALQAACYYGHQQLAQRLLELGADVNAHGGDNCTALQAAVTTENEDLVRLLIEKGAATITECECCRTSLGVALNKGNTVITQILLDHSAEVSFDAVIGTLQRRGGNRQRFETIIPRMKSVHVLQKDEAHSKTILHWAAELGHENVVRRCLGLGADLQDRDIMGETALHHAADNGHLAIAKLLVEGGSEIAAVDGLGRTPLACAQKRRRRVAQTFNSDADVYLEGIRYSQVIVTIINHFPDTYGHSQLKTRHPVRSAIHKQLN
ncbi:Pfs, NACHT and ankyrin domain protein, partial [Aureobasidium melanogenum]